MIRWDGHGKMQGLMQVDGSIMEALRAHAVEAGSSSSEPMSEVIRVSKYVGVSGLGMSFISKEQVAAMLAKAAQEPVCLGVPLCWRAGVRGLHLPECFHRF